MSLDKYHIEQIAAFLFDSQGNDEPEDSFNNYEIVSILSIYAAGKAYRGFEIEDFINIVLQAPLKYTEHCAEIIYNNYNEYQIQLAIKFLLLDQCNKLNDDTFLRGQSILSKLLEYERKADQSEFKQSLIEQAEMVANKKGDTNKSANLSQNDGSLNLSNYNECIQNHLQNIVTSFDGLPSFVIRNCFLIAQPLNNHIKNHDNNCERIYKYLGGYFILRYVNGVITDSMADDLPKASFLNFTRKPKRKYTEQQKSLIAHVLLKPATRIASNLDKTQCLQNSTEYMGIAVNALDNNFRLSIKKLLDRISLEFKPDDINIQTKLTLGKCDDGCKWIALRLLDKELFSDNFKLTALHNDRIKPQQNDTYREIRKSLEKITKRSLSPVRQRAHSISDYQDNVAIRTNISRYFTRDK